MEIKDISIEDKHIFDKIINFSRKNAEASFANLFIWGDIYNTKYSIINDMLCVFYTSDSGVLKTIFPFGNGDIKSTIEIIKNNVFKDSDTFVMTAVCDDDKTKLEKIFGDKVSFEYDRDSSEYVYLSDKLITLSGKKLHAKRNHINKFESIYDYRYKNIEPDDYEKCILAVEEWMHDKYDGNTSEYFDELKTIKKAFLNFEILGLNGGAIYIEDKLVAFTIGERLSYDMAVVHIEKADTNYPGSFAIINREYIKHNWSDIKYINREEDLGIEGLRKAKLSYYPDFLVDKYIATFNI